MSTARHSVIVLCAILTVPLASTVAVGPRFFPDDPIAVDPEHRDAAAVKPHLSTQASDALDLLTRRGTRDIPHAVNVNTIDEVPDSSWYTNRVGTDMSIEQVVRGPLVRPGPAEGAWTIASGESDGPHPRLTARDASGTLYDIRFDARSNPELTTGAEAISTRLLYALGYCTAEDHLVSVRRQDLAIGSGAPVKDGTGRRRLMTATDLDLLLAKAARGGDGRYRAIARRSPDGVDLGPFRFSGVRRDDPNDIFPHEHRRELRGLRVFLAWLDHVDDRPIETRDVLVEVEGRHVVRHCLVDFASTLGSGSARLAGARAANEYSWAHRSKLRTALTLGFDVRPWVRPPDPSLPSVGRYESVFFDPEKWTPSYANEAFSNVRADDEFWAARRVMAVSNGAIRAVVSAARYSNLPSELYLTEALIARRDKIGRTWLNTVLPLVDCQLARAGTLTCANVAIDLHLAEAAGDYRIQWYRFDNRTDSRTAVGAESVVQEPRFTAPRELLDTSDFVAAEIRGRHPRYPDWATPLHVYFRKTSDGWRTVGLTRVPGSVRADAH